MKCFNNITKKVLIVVLLVITFKTPVFGVSVYKDVSESFWAYSFILSVYEKSWMVGDTSGNFNPQGLIDKFNTSRILARMAGYKYQSPSEIEAEYYNKASEKNKNLLQKYKDKFKKWNSSTDAEISFLLEKQILTVDDLNQFVITLTDGSEKVRYLSREEAAMFMVKALNKKEDALSRSYTFKFDDDKEISEAFKPYVYYFKELGVFTPDSVNKFYPKTSVTRAVMATMLDKILKLDKIVNIPKDQTPQGSVDSSIINVESVKGTIDAYFPEVNVLQYLDETNETKIKKLSDDITIYIDGFLKTASDLVYGLSFSGILYDNSLITITAEQSKTPSVVEKDKNDSISTENIVNNNVTGTKISAVITQIDNTYEAITLRQSIVNKNNEVEFSYKTYSFSSTANIKIDDKADFFKNLRVGDFVDCNVTDKILSLETKHINLNIEGELIAKKMDFVVNRPVLIVQSGENIYSLDVNNKTLLTRKGTGETSWNNILIGDKIEFRVINGMLIDLYATGNINFIEGIVDDLYLSQNNSKITLKDNVDLINVYNIVPNSFDIYSLRIGSKIKLKLDSKEAIGFSLISGAAKNIVSGAIKSYDSNISKISIYDNNANYYVREVSLGKDTLIIDGTTGKELNTSFLKENVQVYITLDDNFIAKSIAILK